MGTTQKDAERRVLEPDETLMTDIRLSVFKLNGLLLRDSENRLKGTRLNKPRALVLGVLAQSKKPMTASQIAHEMGQTRQGVGRLVAQLVSEGFLLLEENPYLKNSKLARLTKSGMAAYQESYALHQKLIREKPLPVSARDLKISIDTLNVIIAHLEQEEDAY